MFKDAPIIGQGVHVFGELYLSYLVRLDLPEGYEPEVAFIPWAHNLYLEMLCERGLLGFVAFATMIGGMAWHLKKAWARARGRRERNWVAGLTASLTVFLVMACLDLTFLKDWVTLVFWLLAGLTGCLPELLKNDADPQS
jgi:O-antigen ligase